MHADLPFALHCDPAAGASVLHRDLRARLEREFLGAEELPAIDMAVDDPAVGGTGSASLFIDERSKKIALLVVGVDVLLPVELTDDEVEIVVLLLRHVLDEQAPRHRSSLDERLEHCEHVAAPLWLVGEKRARRVEDARRDQPAGATLEPVGLGEVDDTVVATVPVLQALPHVLFRGARLQAHERVGKVVIAVVILRRKVIAFWFSFLADELGILERLVHVMGDRPHVVEELRIDGPLLVAVPDLLADELRGPLADGVA